MTLPKGHTEPRPAGAREREPNERVTDAQAQAVLDGVDFPPGDFDPGEPSTPNPPLSQEGVIK